MKQRLTVRIGAFSLLISISFGAPCAAVQENARLDDLLNLELQDLAEIRVELASRTEERLFDTAAAVYVLTAEDIRRSGHRRLPELLRLVPGLHVGKLDANNWAISSRNSLSRFTSTMLVMIDGRHVYTPLYAGVYWQLQDVYLEDIERIEVVRGPGASLWGANAVDGIINIVTKSTVDTQGVSAYAAGGSGEMRYDVGARTGGKFGNDGTWRVYAKGFESDSGKYLPASESNNTGLAPVGSDANDQGQFQQTGFRSDWGSAGQRFTLQGDVFAGNFNEDRKVAGAIRPNSGLWQGTNLVFNWDKNLGEGDSLRLRTFYNFLKRADDILDGTETTYDFDFQHTLALGAHRFSWGLGYRNFYDSSQIPDPSLCTVSAPCFGFVPPSKHTRTTSAFLQDRYPLTPTVALTVGSKFENHEITGFDYQPTLRVAWTPDRDQTLWGAVTRSLRTPTRTHTDAVLDFGAFTADISSQTESYVIYTYESGYRRRLGQQWLFDGAIFYSDYRNTTHDGSSGADERYGFDGMLKYQASAQWRMELGYALHVGGEVTPSGIESDTRLLPKHAAQLRSNHDLGARTEFDVYLYYVDDVVSSTLTIPAYTRIDLRLGRRLDRNWNLSLWLTNLLDESHPESSDATKINTGVPRGALLRIEYGMKR